MKLYQVALSPFAARVRIQIRAKGLDVELAEPPGGLGSEAYRRIVPTGKVPALALDEGTVIGESLVIGEYLEDRFPDPPLRPADPLGRARMRYLSHFPDAYIFPALHALYPHVLEPATRDAEVVAAHLAELAPRYDQLAAALAPGGPCALGPRLTLADCALFPIFFFATRVHPMLGDADPTASRPALAAWWQGVRQQPAVAKVDAELAQALAEMLAAR